mgnify:CR=1 FL=1
MNEFPRLRAKVDAAEQRMTELEQQAKKHESMILRLAEQINIMQQQRKPGRKPKTDGTI